MTKIKLLVELEYDESIMHDDSQEEIDWFYNHVLAPEDLCLHSNVIGDEVGKITHLEVV